jgi:hypothetical protein
VTCQILDTRNDPSWTGGVIYIFLLDPRGYQPAKGRPCVSKSARLKSRIYRVGRGGHTQRPEYTGVDKVRVAHASQRGHDVCANHVHLFFILSHYKDWGAEIHT